MKSIIEKCFINGKIDMIKEFKIDVNVGSKDNSVVRCFVNDFKFFLFVSVNVQFFF